ncbi:hypothetical protein SASPL_118878 [Salvia splendens]|uniref:DUF4408 domain-containing protein n=1 Tax=Salvia splendens TaxID=180675 RepID=A0A8X8XXJ6_SALSN|nr:hypothetical protein SASPL_118878 [Salvia splendens]
MLKLFLIACVLIVTPLLSAPLRSKYLYLIANILVLAVGAEAGLISFFFASPENNKQSSSPLKSHEIILSQNDEQIIVSDQCGNNGIVMSENNVGEEAEERPSIFFIEDQDEEEEEEDEEESGDGELFHKAETFIGDFYKQLKMQREESWKKLHDIYQKAF